MASRLFAQNSQFRPQREPTFYGMFVPILGRDQDLELIKHLWFLRDNRPFNILSCFYCENSTQVYFSPLTQDIVKSPVYSSRPQYRLSNMVNASTWYTEEKHQTLLERQQSMAWPSKLYSDGLYNTISSLNTTEAPFFVPQPRLYVNKGVNLNDDQKPLADPFLDPELAAQHEEIQELVPIFAYPFNLSRAHLETADLIPEGTFQVHVELSVVSAWSAVSESISQQQRVILRPQQFAEAFFLQLIDTISSCPFMILPVDVCNRFSLYTFLLSYNTLVSAYNYHAVFFDNFPPTLAVIIFNSSAFHHALATEFDIRDLFEDSPWNVQFYNYGNLFPAVEAYTPPRRYSTGAIPWSLDSLETLLETRRRNAVRLDAPGGLQHKQDLANFLDQMLISAIQNDYIPTPVKPRANKPLIPFSGRTRRQRSAGLHGRGELKFHQRLPRPLTTPVKFPLRYPIAVDTRLTGTVVNEATSQDDHEDKNKQKNSQKSNCAYRLPSNMPHWCIFDHDHMTHSDTPPKAPSPQSQSTSLIQCLKQPVTHNCVGLQGMFFNVYPGSDSKWTASRVIEILQQEQNPPSSQSPQANTLISQPQPDYDNETTSNDILSPKLSQTINFLTLPYYSDIATEDLFKKSGTLLSSNNLLESHPHSDDTHDNDKDVDKLKDKEKDKPKPEKKSWFSRLFSRHDHEKGSNKPVKPSGPAQIKCIKQSFHLYEGPPTPFTEFVFLNHATNLIAPIYKTSTNLSELVKPPQAVETEASEPAQSSEEGMQPAQNTAALDTPPITGAVTTTYFNSPLSNRHFYSTTFLDPRSTRSLWTQLSSLGESHRKTSLPQFFKQFSDLPTHSLQNISQNIDPNAQTKPFARPYHFSINCALPTDSQDSPSRSTVSDRLLHESLFYCSVVTKAQMITALQLHKTSDPTLTNVPTLDNRFQDYDGESMPSEFMPDGKYGQTTDKTVIAYAHHPAASHKASEGVFRVPYSPPEGASLGFNQYDHYGANMHFDQTQMQLLPHFYLVIDEPNTRTPWQWSDNNSFVENWFKLQYPSRCRRTIGNQVHEYFYAVVTADKEHEIQDILLQFMQMAIVFRMERYESLE